MNNITEVLPTSVLTVVAVVLGSLALIILLKLFAKSSSEKRGGQVMMNSQTPPANHQTARANPHDPFAGSKDPFAGSPSPFDQHTGR